MGSNTGGRMSIKDTEFRTESAFDANYQRDDQNDFDEIRRVLKEGIQTTGELIEYYRSLKEVEDRDRTKEKERIGTPSEGSDISAGSEIRTGNAG
jgi:hypothetical protein